MDEFPLENCRSHFPSIASGKFFRVKINFRTRSNEISIYQYFSQGLNMLSLNYKNGRVRIRRWKNRRTRWSASLSFSIDSLHVSRDLVGFKKRNGLRVETLVDAFPPSSTPSSIFLPRFVTFISFPCSSIANASVFGFDKSPTTNTILQPEVRPSFRYPPQLLPSYYHPR